MGYYLETDCALWKAAAIAEKFGTVMVTKAEAREAMDDPTKGVIVIVNNVFFEAAGFAFSLQEWDAFNSQGDLRRKEYVILDRDVTKQETGYEGE